MFKLNIEFLNFRKGMIGDIPHAERVMRVCLSTVYIGVSSF